MSKNAYFGAMFGRFWAKILILLRGSKSFGTHISENQLGTSFPLFFGRAEHQNGPEGENLAQNDQKCQFWAKFGRSRAKNEILPIEKVHYAWYITSHVR